MTAYERSGWRDQAISDRHRKWGFNCPAADLDFLAVEYNLGLPVAIVEYKHKQAKKPDLKHPTYRALTALANMAELPFMVVFYCNEEWWFKVYPINDMARQHFTKGQAMTEREYVTALYALRTREIERSVLAFLKTDKPPMS